MKRISPHPQQEGHYLAFGHPGGMPDGPESAADFRFASGRTSEDTGFALPVRKSAPTDVGGYGRKDCLLIFLLVLLLANLASAADFYVSSVSEISVTLSYAQPGDTLIMRNGPWQDADIVFRGAGTEASPITLRAQTPGRVLLSGNSRLRISGSYLVVDGLQFTNGYRTSGDVIAFRYTSGSISEAANNCRLVNCAMVDYSPPDATNDTKWVSIYGTSNRVENCYFKGKSNLGSTIVVWVDAQPDRPNYHCIAHNYFGPRPPLGVNGGETVRVGTADVSMNLSRTLVEHNYFEQCNGDVEIISNKSCENTYRHNTFVECEGALSLRHGNRCVVEANYFFGRLKPKTGGVRIIGEDHKVCNNYCAELTGATASAALSMMQGLENSPLNGYFQVQRAVVAFNTFVNCQNTLLIGLAGTLTGSTQMTTLPPIDCVIANNLALGSAGKLVDQRITPINLRWEGNILFGTTLGIAANSGISQVDPKLALAADGLWRPGSNSPALRGAQGVYDFVTEDMEGQSRPAAKDIGCDQWSAAPVTQPPLTSLDVGPPWMQPENTVLTWVNPADIIYGTPLGPAQLDAIANVPGTFDYTPPAGTILNAGVGRTLSVIFTPSDLTRYGAATQRVSITVIKATPAINWSNPTAITYGTALGPSQLNATAAVPGSFGYVPPAGTVLNAGDGQTLLGIFTPADAANYTTNSRSVAINVQPATPVITWSNPAPITNGTPLGPVQLNATANVPGTFVYTPPAGTILNAGTGQALSVTFTPADFANYTEATRTVSIDVKSSGKLVPVITWSTPADITVGTALTAAQLNAMADVPGSFVYSPSAGTVLNAGSGQKLSVTFTPFDTTNYTVAMATVTINVRKPVPFVRVAYLIPTNRVAQSHAVSSLQHALLLYQNWFRDQMEQNGFGPKTFVCETEPDGVTPRIHVLILPETDAELGADIWGGRITDAAIAAGLPVGTPGQIWWLVPEIHVEDPDGSIFGGLEFGYSYGGSGDAPGWAMVGSDALAFYPPAYLTNNTEYDNLILPEIGPYPLKQGLSFSWFEGSSLSSLSSSFLGAGLREIATALGLDHDFRNDENFNGNLMGHGFRGFRGAVFPRLYPYNYTRLSYGAALALNVSPYFNVDKPGTDTTKPTMTITTSGARLPVNGLLRISFSASDPGGLSAALLAWKKDFDWVLVDEMVLSGASASRSFATAYYDPGQTNEYSISVFDLQGNRQSAGTTIIPAAGWNQAPLPYITVNPPAPALGEDVVLDASATFDAEHSASLLEVEWDLDGDGIFDTAPTTTLAFTNRYLTLGPRLVRARLTDPAGAGAVSAPLAINVVPCAATLSPTNRVHGYGAATGTVSVATSTHCLWSVINTNDWITVTSSPTGMGDGRVSYVVAPNPGFVERSGTLIIADQYFHITQQGILCTFSLSPTTRFHGYGAATNTVKVTTKAECPWTVINTNTWITITSTTNGTGSGTVSYAVAANPGATVRLGVVTIGDQAFTLGQWGSDCAYVLSPPDQVLDGGSATGQVTVTASSGCSWSVINTNDWIALTAATNGTGNGAVSYVVGTNPGLSPRIGVLNIAGALFTLTQAPCSYHLSPVNRVHDCGPDSGSVIVTVSGDCPWTVNNTSRWITITSSLAGTGSGTVSYTVAPNPGNGERTGILRIAGKPFTVAQLGAPCTFDITPLSWAHGEGWDVGEVAVNAGAECSWKVVNTNDWITILSSPDTIGTESVIYFVDANAGPARSGTLLIAGQSFTVKQARGMRVAGVGDMAVAGGETACLPVLLETHGSENTFNFSLCYDPGLLTFVSARAGGGFHSAALRLDTNALALGQVGVSLALPAGRAAAAGTQAVVEVCFRGAMIVGSAFTPLMVCDQPVERQVVDVIGQSLPVSFNNGTAKVVGECTLGVAMDAPAFAWTTDSSAPWTCETNVTYDGENAAGSGAIADGGSSSMLATLTGPGTLRFWWKVSSEPANDRLRFYVDGTEQARISGEIDWQEVTFSLPAGAQELEWRYSKNSSLSAGQDRGWVDQVKFAPALPAITSQPGDQSVEAGATVILRVTATGTPPLAYLWQFNGANLVDGGGVRGATTATLTLSNAQPAQAGAYSVLVSNAAGSVLSANALLTVTALLPLPEALDTPNWVWTTSGSASWAGQPAITHDGIDAARSGTVADGQYSSLLTTITGPGILGFWWKVSSEPSNDRLRFYLDGSEQARISGEVDWQWQTFTVSAGSHTLEWRYSKNSSVSAGQDRGWVDQVQFGPAPPALTSQPVSQNVDAGATVTFSVAASGTPPLSYRWRWNGADLADGGNLRGAATATLTLTNAQPAQNGAYSVVVSNASGSVTSTDAVLTVTPVVPLAEALDAPALVWTTSGSPVWVGQPLVTHDGVDAARSGAIADDGTTSIRTTVTGPGTVSFWWKISSEPSNDRLRFYVGGSEQARISGEVDWQWRTFSVSSGSQTLEWRYSKNGDTAAGQDRAWVDQVVYVPNGVPTAPVIGLQPVSQTVVAAANVSFTVGAVGSTPLSYQWLFNGANLVNGGNISGATTTSLTLAGVQGAQGGTYSVVVSNAAGSVTSVNALLVVIAAPLVTNQPASQTVIAGATVTLNVGAIGLAPLSYQWQCNGTNLVNGGNVSGATTAALRLANAQTAQTGRYSVIVSNAAGTAASDEALLTVIAPPAITSQPRSQTGVAGTNAMFTVGTGGSPPMSYQWRFNGGNLVDGGNVSGAATASLSLSNAQPVQAGTYSVVVSNAVGSATSSNALLTVLAPPVLTRQPANQSVGEGANVAFTVAATGTAPLSYQWRFNGANLVDGGSISGATTPGLALANVRPVHAGSYSVAVSNLAGRVISSNALLAVAAPLTLGTALDAPYLGWNTGLSAPWVVETNVTQDGVGAARSGAISNSQASWLETTVLGPGTVRFWWKISSQTNQDRLLFYVSGSEWAGISGEVDWQWETFEVPPGTQVLRWVYAKDASGTNGQDRAWLDGVVFSPSTGPMAPIITSEPASQETAPGATVSFSVAASGTAPLSYQWRFNGWDLADGDTVTGATTPTLTLGNVQAAQEGTYTVVARNAYGLAISPSAALTIIPVISLGEALDTPNGQVWVVGGYSAWIGQSRVTYDWLDAAESGALPNSQTNWIETTVTGPAAVSFWWKVSSETNHDRLRFYVNGVELANISGEVDWRWRTFDLTNLSQVVRWAYTKDSAGSAGADRGWVDQVLFGPAAPVITTFPMNATAEAGATVPFDVSVTGSQPLDYQWRFNGFNLADGGIVSGSTNRHLVLTNVQPPQAGAYSVLVANPGGRAISSNAFLTLFAGRPLSEALDTTNLTWTAGWTSGGDAPWTKQTSMTHDGLDAAQTGAITNSQETWLETRVVGPGRVTFWWRASSELDFDRLRFYIGGVNQTSISGEMTNWVQATFDVPPGLQALRWRYVKNSTVNAGQDRGWVDQVQFAPTIPPVITNQPVSQTVDAGSTVSFSVAASGTTPLSYQWRWNGISLVDGGSVSGSTTATLKLSNVQLAQAGNYSVVVTNAAATVISSNALLTVIPAIPLPEALDTPGWSWTTSGSAAWAGQTNITHDRVDAARSGAILDGQTTSLQTTINGPGTVTFWWKVSSEPSNDRLRLYVDGSEQARISGEVDWQWQMSTLSAGSHACEWRYSKNSSVTAGQDRGWVDQVQFTDGPLAPVITSQPVGQNVGAGLTVTFTVGAGGSAPLTYQWRCNGTNLVNGGNVSGATSATLELDNVQPPQTGIYTVVVSNAVGSVTSADALLTVATAPAIVTQPASQTVGAGSTVTFNVGASGAPLFYQWRLNGANLADGGSVSGATTSALTLSNVQSAQAGSYSVVVSNAQGRVTSSNALLTVFSVSTLAEALDTPNWVWTTEGAALWIGQPMVTHDGVDAAWSGAIADGQSSSMLTTLNGPGTLSFWWKVSSEPSNDRLRFYVDGSEQARISGEVDWQQVTFSIPDGAQELEWRYSKNSSLSAGQDRGWVDQVRFTAVAPVITSQPINQNADAGTTVNLGVVASGTPPLTYQWRLNGVKLTDGGNVSGAAAATLILANVQLAQSGTYSVVVSNAAGSVTSSNAVLTVTPVVPLAEALDTPTWVWTVGGNGTWVGQAAVSHDGVDAARSGSVGNSQYAWIQTTVTGPGTLGFWWKVSSEANNDTLRFYLNGSEQVRISGEVDWQWRSYSLSSGSQTLQWRYSKNSSTTAGQDRAWVDQVQFTSGTLMATAEGPGISGSVRAHIAVRNDRVVLTWRPVSGKAYRVLFKDSLLEGEWRELPGEIVVTDSVAVVEDSVNGRMQRFYWVKED